MSVLDDRKCSRAAHEAMAAGRPGNQKALARPPP
jgi:hypothetical protein